MAALPTTLAACPVYPDSWPTYRVAPGPQTDRRMMAAKARLFGDREAVWAILGAEELLTCKKIGRTMRNYDDRQWSAARFDLVVAGNIAKFSQTGPLREHLLASDDAILVEAAPRDTIWGIGLGRENPAAHDPLRWRRRNRPDRRLVLQPERLRLAGGERRPGSSRTCLLFDVLFDDRQQYERDQNTGLR
jgi:ribA/ribD-fused uncharacterized protein